MIKISLSCLWDTIIASFWSFNGWVCVVCERANRRALTLCECHRQATYSFLHHFCFVFCFLLLSTFCPLCGATTKSLVSPDSTCYSLMLLSLRVFSSHNSTNELVRTLSCRIVNNWVLRRYFDFFLFHSFLSSLSRFFFLFRKPDKWHMSEHIKHTISNTYTIVATS